MQLKGKPRWEALKSIFWGAILTVAMGGFWYGVLGNPFTHYELMTRGVDVEGNTHNCIQEYAESDSGQGGLFQNCGYSFEVDGSTYGGTGVFANDTLDGDSVAILYLPENPDYHARKQGAATGFFDWLFRKVLVGLLLLAMFVGAPVSVLYGGLKNFYLNRLDPSG